MIKTGHIIIFPFFHQEKKWIGIKYQFNYNLITSLYEEFKLNFSKEDHCWYLPYQKIIYDKLTALNIPFVIDKVGNTATPKAKSDNTNIRSDTSDLVSLPREESIAETNIQVNEPGKVKIDWNGNKFRIEIAYQENDVQFVKSLAGSYWSVKHKIWMSRGNIKNLTKLQSHFVCWTNEDYQKLYELIALKEDPMTVEIYVTPQFHEECLVKLSGYRTDYTYIKSISLRKYDSHLKRWIIPRNKRVLSALISNYEKAGAKVINRVPETKKGVYKKQEVGFEKRVSYLVSKFDNKYLSYLKSYTSTLIVQKYSWKTIQTYTGKFGRFLEHFDGREIENLEAEDVNKYLRAISSNDISESLLNIIHSAIKFYYEKVIYNSEFHLDKLKRPRKGKYLPTLLSEKEVDRLLRTFNNLKHLTIAYSIYGGGMRLSELLNIRVQDIYWDRNQIHIKHGKGNKDRITLLSQSLKQLLVRYFDEYQPKYWLFEGRDRNGPYTAGSVQKIIKQAANRAGISRRVTPHTLRHCFATHLLDRGTDIRFIQELLGHKDIKTTLIYTHVTTRSMEKIVSPLDRLGLESEILEKSVIKSIN